VRAPLTPLSKCSRTRFKRRSGQQQKQNLVYNYRDFETDKGDDHVIANGPSWFQFGRAPIDRAFDAKATWYH